MSPTDLIAPPKFSPKGRNGEAHNSHYTPYLPTIRSYIFSLLFVGRKAMGINMLIIDYIMNQFKILYDMSSVMLSVPRELCYFFTAILSVIYYLIFNSIIRPHTRRSTVASVQPENRTESSNRQQEYHLDYDAKSTMQNRHFKFMYKYVGGSWRAYIMCNINYGSRPTDGHTTHRYFDSALGRYYICWSESVKMLDDMVCISKRWADNTMELIKSGARF